MKRRDQLNSRRSRLADEEVEREEKAVNRLAVEALAELPTEDRSAVWAMLKERSEPTHDEVTGAPGSGNHRPRKEFDTTLSEPDLSGDDTFLPPPPLLAEHQKPPLQIEQAREFYARFRLRDWQLSQETRFDAAPRYKVRRPLIFTLRTPVRSVDGGDSFRSSVMSGPCSTSWPTTGPACGVGKNVHYVRQFQVDAGR
jgi:hypothetical protein